MNTPSAAPVNTQAERVIVVSLMKSGTHLIQELMVALGYGIYGQSRIPPEIRPKLDEGTRRRIMAMVYGENGEARTPRGKDAASRSDAAWAALGWAWQLKFGLPLVNRYGGDLVNDDLVRRARHQTAAAPFSDTPAGVCWILPEFDIAEIDGRFLNEWSASGEPRIIFNYRDPRDVLLSMVNFLSGKTAAGFGNFNEFRVFARIIEAMPTMQERLAYSLADPAFPGGGDFEKHLWLLHHPDVCKVSFEELIGAQGGGSAEQQHQAVHRIATFLSSGTDPASVKDRLFREDAFSFFKGQIGSWRKEFDSVTEGKFVRRYGKILEAYGYELKNDRKAVNQTSMSDDNYSRRETCHKHKKKKDGRPCRSRTNVCWPVFPGPCRTSGRYGSYASTWNGTARRPSRA